MWGDTKYHVCDCTFDICIFHSFTIRGKQFSNLPHVSAANGAAFRCPPNEHDPFNRRHEKDTCSSADLEEFQDRPRWGNIALILQNVLLDLELRFLPNSSGCS